ncbi:hypothetical protein [Arthrobacter dokdonensis]|uniref:hypothetical protein n=1 Tax=Arthrobacter dokdonellae TaxID=2211210 RepID=UPI000DE58FE4|nr:hypothetical protein [Arthrobacter dokdonellae]
MNTTPNWHPFGRPRAEDLALLAAGEETGWWDETGRPAPFPEDFLDPNAGWTTDQDTGINPATNDPENPSF